MENLQKTKVSAKTEYIKMDGLIALLKFGLF